MNAILLANMKYESVIMEAGVGMGKTGNTEEDFERRMDVN